MSKDKSAPRVPKKKAARKVGRPTKYKPEFCELVIEVGSKGGWLSEMAEACDVVRSQMDVWSDKHPEFSEALMRAKQKAQAWFEREGRKGLKADRFNSALWQKQMSARHPTEYTERRQTELSGPDGAPLRQVIVLPPEDAAPE